jgi:hypothetical protein
MAKIFQGRKSQGSRQGTYGVLGGLDGVGKTLSAVPQVVDFLCVVVFRGQPKNGDYGYLQAILQRSRQGYRVRNFQYGVQRPQAQAQLLAGGDG